MAIDVLAQLLQQVRQQMAQTNSGQALADDAWASIERTLRQEWGGRREYIYRRPKANTLAKLEAAMAESEQHSIDQIAQKVGITPRRARQLKALTGRR